MYFRNALVRANYENIANEIYKSKDYLIHFLSYLLLNESHSLKNRELHIHFSDTVKTEFDTVNDTVFSLIEKNKQITTKEISEKIGVSLSTVKRKINSLKQSGVLERIGSDKAGYWKINN